MYSDAHELLNEAIITDCCILSQTRYILITQKDMGDDYDPWSMPAPPTSIVAYDSELNIWGAFQLDEGIFTYPVAAHIKQTSNPSDKKILNNMLVVEDGGDVFYYNGADRNNRHFEKRIAEKLMSGINNIKNIYGTIYITGIFRDVLRYEGMNQWISITRDLKSETIEIARQIDEKGGSFRPGFECIDGFATDRDLYAAGGHSDVWHYNGKDWHPVDIPLADMRITCICCASDGYVYIAGEYGTLLKGKNDYWQDLTQQELDWTDFRDMVDYAGTLYLCTEQTLYTLQGDQLQPVDFGDMGEPFSFSALYVNHGQLMASGSFHACVYDGKQWRSLYGNPKADEITDFAILNQVTDQLEDTLDTLGEAVDKLKQPQNTP